MSDVFLVKRDVFFFSSKKRWCFFLSKAWCFYFSSRAAHTDSFGLPLYYFIYIYKKSTFTPAMQAKCGIQHSSPPWDSNKWNWDIVPYYVDCPKDRITRKYCEEWYTFEQLLNKVKFVIACLLAGTFLSKTGNPTDLLICARLLLIDVADLVHVRFSADSIKIWAKKSSYFICNKFINWRFLCALHSKGESGGIELENRIRVHFRKSADVFHLHIMLPLPWGFNRKQAPESLFRLDGTHSG